MGQTLGWVKPKVWGIFAGVAAIAIQHAPLAIAQASTALPSGGSIAQENETAIADDPSIFCRRVDVPDGLLVHEKPNSSSVILGALRFDSELTLVEDFRAIETSENEMWIEVAAPVPGYVLHGLPSDSNLGFCGSATSNAALDATESLCRQVNRLTAPIGLKIRADASGRSPSPGGLDAGDRVLLLPGYTLVDDREGGRHQWVRLAYPRDGYVPVANLIYCF
jgi:hypothetical protein